MSRAYEYAYELEEKMQKKIYLNRVRSTTEQYYSRYMEQYNRMKKDGYAAYIPSEMARLSSDLGRIRSMLESDPEEARELSYALGPYIKGMSSLVDAAKEQFRRSEQLRIENLRMEREQHQSDLVKVYFEILKSITDPIVANYSVSDFQALKKDIDNGVLTDRSKLETKAKAITANAEKKANEWKTEVFRSKRRANVDEVINETEHRIKNENIEDKEKTQQFLERIKQLRSGLSEGKADAETIEKQLNTIETEVDNTLVS